MALDAKTLAEIQRKAQLGIALTNSTADKQALYDTTRATTDKEIARKAGAGQALTNTGSQYNNDMYAKLVAAQKPVDTGIIATDTTPTTTPSTTPSNTASNYIESINNAKQQAIFSQLDKSKNAALSGLQNERSGIQPKYYDQRNQVAAGSQQSARSLAEFMANRGGTRSGANAQAEISRQGVQQGNLGTLGRQEAQAYTDIERRTSDLNSAYESDRASAVSGIEADRMSALLSQFNTDKQFGLQEAGLTGQYNGQQTLAGQQFGLNKQNQEWNQGFQNKQFDYGVTQDNRNFDYTTGRDTVLDTRYNNEFQYTQGRDKVADQRWESEFERIKKQDGVANAINWAQNSISQQNANTSATSTANSNANQIADRSQREKEFKYTQEQDTIANNLKAGKAPDYNYKDDSEFKEEVANFMKDPLGAAAYMRENSQQYIEKYGYDGYNALFGMTKK